MCFAQNTVHLVILRTTHTSPRLAICAPATGLEESTTTPHGSRIFRRGQLFANSPGGSKADRLTMYRLYVVPSLFSPPILLGFLFPPSNGAGGWT